MAKIVKLDEQKLKRIISEELSKLYMENEEESRDINEISEYLKRYKIADLLQRLNDKRVPRSRQKEIVRFFKKFLGDGPYYTFPSYAAKDCGMKVRSVYRKEINPDSEKGGYERLGRNYKPYGSWSTYSLTFGKGQIRNGPEFPIIIQEDMMNFSDSAYVYFVNDDFLNEYL